tara:strand:- start:1742 stop:1915 length:174 start_codon:yes stop_codon:yes gene_type:complete
MATLVGFTVYCDGRTYSTSQRQAMWISGWMNRPLHPFVFNLNRRFIFTFMAKMQEKS